ncbi:hypothetical protein SAMN00790413_06479 [Deinococcus hopiensis KR-140]|uniref:Uncharacterized protein n=1 Tax=Deinococcus hopiensis KR-140 TaxID=695939 RepID=A0A1W1UAK2_9DEIO|nr:hypothetical protein SAMN00790413_06479 [Deinococcus hopiensis KR-140]
MKNRIFSPQLLGSLAALVVFSISYLLREFYIPRYINKAATNTIMLCSKEKYISITRAQYTCGKTIDSMGIKLATVDVFNDGSNAFYIVSTEDISTIYWKQRNSTFVLNDIIK